MVKKKDERYYWLKKSGYTAIRWVFPKSDKELLIKRVEKVEEMLEKVKHAHHSNNAGNTDTHDTIDKCLKELEEVKKEIQLNFNTLYKFLDSASAYYVEIIRIIKNGETYIVEKHRDNDGPDVEDD